MQRFSYLASAALALCGAALSVVGIAAEQWKAFGIGLVLIFAAGVFATLYVGTRWTGQRSDP